MSTNVPVAGLRAKTVTDMRIVYKGASASAMLGTEADYSPSHQREK